MRPFSLPEAIPTAAFAFRGYDVANLGRTPELLDHPAYGPTVEAALREAGDACRAATGRPADLVGRVRRREETRGLDTYAEDVALVVAASVAQVRLLEDRFAAPLRRARLAFGYSLGELSALIAAGVYGLADLLRVPLALAADAADLAADVTMGVLFSRGTALDVPAVRHLCLEINQDGTGVIGVSAVLSPNCVLLLGQGGTVDRFAAGARARLAGPVAVRKNPHRWPPLHTPITWQRALPNRAAVLLQTARGGLTAPPVPILSGVTGRADYAADNSRDLLQRWVDHPQRLWDQVAGTLAAGVRTVVHVGPAPNLIPATFRRLAEDVRGQLDGSAPGSLGRRLVSRLARRPWLAQLLPAGAALLRAPAVRHINLEDWLLEQGGAAGGARPAAVESAAAPAP